VKVETASWDLDHRSVLQFFFLFLILPLFFLSLFIFIAADLSPSLRTAREAMAAQS
jgi:hypothetical protein